MMARSAAPSTPQKLMDINDLADYLGIPVPTIRKWRYEGKGPIGVKIGKYVRWHPDEVERWLTQLGREQAKVR